MTEVSERATGSPRHKLAFWFGTVPGRALAVVSCLLLFAMMALTFVDVAGRYLFNSPLPALHEIISFTMPGIIFCVLPTVCFREGHVTIDLLDGFVPQHWKRWQGFAVNLFSAAAMALIGWRLAVRAYDHFQFDEATDELYLSLWPFSLFAAVLSAVAVVALIAAAGGYLAGVRHHPSLPGAGRA
ncbi:MAG: TRAP transporter small permease [Alphaproteobacteria bacterium]|nr:TRAP transporter small permease [Alphaproteobacteria bacterium]